MPRIVSLIASATEIICALGFEKDLVGRSHECDFPETVQRLPVCTEPKFDVAGSSREIDQRVKDTLRDATSVYRVHTDILKELQPDVIVTQAQCEVCAVSLKDVEQALCGLLESQPRVVSLNPNALADVWQDIQAVADALGAADRGKALVQQLQQRMTNVGVHASWDKFLTCQDNNDKLKTCPTKRELQPKTVACLEWLDPLMAAGNWMPELVEMAGGVNLFGVAGKHAPWMEWEELCRKNPDVIIALPCGFDLARTKSEMVHLMSWPEWSELHAVRENQVYATDGNQYFNRPGPRLVESLEILAEILHPEAFHFGHEGKGWQRVG